MPAHLWMLTIASLSLGVTAALASTGRADESRADAHAPQQGRPADNLNVLPADLPVPIDDGAARHLKGLKVPSTRLRSTAGRIVDLAALPGRTVVYCYPRTGRPGQEVPRGWNDVPGARGCTPEACAYRDHHGELRAHGVTVFGLSTQDTAYQREAVERLHLPFELLSDESLELVHALGLPTFDFDGVTLVKRLTLIVRDGRVEHVFYPVFPPDQNPEQVIGWLSAHRLNR